MSKYATVDPTTGRTVKEFASLTDAEARAALEDAHSAYGPWRRLELKERATVVGRIADLHREHAEELAQLMTLEMGKPISQSRGEVELAASIYEYYATKGPDLLLDEELEIAGSGRAVVRTAPIGALLGVMPWNFPYYQVARFVAPNLLLGNTILLKHAATCPQQSLRIDEIVREAGAPEGVYANVFATNDQVAEMIASTELQGVSLTGSERAGRIIGGLAGQHLKKAVLELGGSDPFLVLPGADVASTAAAAAVGRFNNAGQACTSSKRLIVEDSLWDDFLPAFLAKANEWTTGDPTSDATKLGPMASVAARADLAEQVQDAIDKGAEVHLGGKVPEGEGAYYPATVLTGVTPDMRAFREELFGPVAVVYRAEDVDAAVELANDSPFGLGSAVFTQDQQLLVETADRIEAGMVGLNTTIRSAPDMPFGGVKSSGIGRELGRFGIDEFSNKKLIRFA